MNNLENTGILIRIEGKVRPVLRHILNGSLCYLKGRGRVGVSSDQIRVWRVN
jgi:hypothetical protein